MYDELCSKCSDGWEWEEIISCSSEQLARAWIPPPPPSQSSGDKTGNKGLDQESLTHQASRRRVKRSARAFGCVSNLHTLKTVWGLMKGSRPRPGLRNSELCDWNTLESELALNTCQALALSFSKKSSYKKKKGFLINNCAEKFCIDSEKLHRQLIQNCPTQFNTNNT